MKHLDLFSGIGGFALAARWTGVIETVGFCEIEPFSQKVIKKHWPDVPIHDDIKTLKNEGQYGSIDIITGGFPCQPFSVAGQQKGKEDNRDLWPEMFRVIREFKPTWIIGENVSGFINMAFDRTSNDLENEGFEVQAFIIPACGVNAPHKRDRVWIVAYVERVGYGGGDSERCSEPHRKVKTMSDTNLINDDESRFRASKIRQQASSEVFGMPNWESEPGICRVANGISGRVDRLKGLGNSIVPKIAYHIMTGICEG